MTSRANICAELKDAPCKAGAAGKGQRRKRMKTEAGKKTITYQGIIANLMALKDEVQKTSRAEAEAIQEIVANLVDLEAATA